MQKKIHTLKKVPFKVTLFSIREYPFKTVINYIHYTPFARKKQTTPAIQIFFILYRLCRKGKNMPGKEPGGIFLEGDSRSAVSKS
ncbi:hypothetical protein AWM70_21030 [Paenibacillus yonginensis]|uniref:Uncharacterized protein n=1 Tax=Paenibacillus yonginensis TaxID=1462996 RepID=A0A1B1N5Q1_9BACL|nr:hypothetical protein AWM70_21030 [Paenibacillus yonginensis]